MKKTSPERDSGDVSVLFIVQLSLYYMYNKRKHFKEAVLMKGYIVNNGYMGYIGGSYLLFASEADYREYMED